MTPVQPPASICILRLSAIGDCCHVLPALRSLQRAFPDTSLSWIIGTTEYGLMAGIEGVEFITADKRAGWRGLLDLRRRLRGREFPVLLDMHASLRANLVSSVVNARRRIGYDRARARDGQWLFCTERIRAVPGQHVCDAMLEFVRHLGVSDTVTDWSLPLDAADRAAAREWLGDAGPTVVIAPCSSQRTRNFRNWPVGRFAAVARHLAEERGATVLLTGAGSPAEREYARTIVAAAGPRARNLVARTSLKELAALIEAADLVICPDSGPVHIATAVGTPVIGLYATSNPARTGPYRDPLGLTVNRYPDAVAHEFGCSPEELRWGQRVRNPRAMELITVADVMERVTRAL